VSRTAQQGARQEEDIMVRIEQIAQEIYEIVGGNDDFNYFIRADNYIPKTKFSNSYNSPDGEKTTKLPGLCIINTLQCMSNSYDCVLKGVKFAQRMGYGKYIFLVTGKYSSSLTGRYANDPYEGIITNNKIVKYWEFAE
jgi:hypothetical protein